MLCVSRECCEKSNYNLISNNRQARGTTEPLEDSKDILSGRYDPNSLKVGDLHLMPFHNILKLKLRAVDHLYSWKFYIVNFSHFLCLN